MITFLICLALLITSYFTYARFLERKYKVNAKAPMPSKRLYDGVDYIPLPKWRAFLIQLLNIAGVGPIFGAIMGAAYGPVVFLWITLGGILLGATYDFLSGLTITRHNGTSITEIISKHLGPFTGSISRLAVMLFCLLTSVVFLQAPANILIDMVPQVNYWWWIGIFLAYYFIATFMPIDKIIARFYPYFGIALICMAIFLLIVLFTGEYSIPELTGIENYRSNAAQFPIVPTLFTVVACGAISGLHATQSSIVARCLTNEKEYRPVFFGAMISESIIALIWAAISMAFFGITGLNDTLAAHDAPWIVNTIATSTLGMMGSVVVVLGVVVAPLTTGDTTLRTTRLMVADFLHINQHKKVNRIYIAIPLFALVIAFLFVDFDVLWRYFAWGNQSIAALFLWSMVVYLKRSKLPIWFAFAPAVIMTYICACFLFISPLFVGLGPRPLSYVLGAAITLIFTFLVQRRHKKSTS